MVAAGRTLPRPSKTASPTMQEEAVDRVVMAQEHAVYDAQLPGMRIESKTAAAPGESCGG